MHRAIAISLGLIIGGCITIGTDGSGDDDTGSGSDGGSGSGSGSDSGSGTSSGAACRSMCKHVYQDCNYTMVDETGAPIEQSVCESECPAAFSTTEITCLTTATCSDEGFDSCFAPSPPPADSGGFGAACHCTATATASPQAGISCSGSDDGCAGLGFSGELSCMAQRQTGSGTCTYRCSASQYNTQGSCPSGYTCLTSPYTDPSGAYFPVCYRN